MENRSNLNRHLVQRFRQTVLHSVSHFSLSILTSGVYSVLGESRYYPVSNPIPKPNVAIAIASDSARLEVLQPFPSHFNHLNPRGFELPSATVLMRVRGKCTTDHISAAVCPPVSILFLPDWSTGTLVEIQGSFDKHF